jgi:hypothetical protein
MSVVHIDGLYSDLATIAMFAVCLSSVTCMPVIGLRDRFHASGSSASIGIDIKSKVCSRHVVAVHFTESLEALLRYTIFP